VVLRATRLINGRRNYCVNAELRSIVPRKGVVVRTILQFGTGLLRLLHNLRARRGRITFNRRRRV
jgi:hypothetical protein